MKLSVKFQSVSGKPSIKAVILIFILMTSTYLFLREPCSIHTDFRIDQVFRLTNSSIFYELLHMHELAYSSAEAWDKRPVIVTAASSNHFKESLGLIANINEHLRPKYQNIHLIYFDIGLNENETTILQKEANVELRSFPFSVFPEHVKRLQTYAWKPLVISLMLREFDFIMWVDTSIRFEIDLPIDTLFQNAKALGIQALNGEGNIAERTSIDTMRFLQQKPSDFKHTPEVQTGWIVVGRTKFTIQYIIQPWVLCALLVDCIYPESAKLLPHECKRTKQTEQFGLCHRPEQSVFGIILSRLFRNRHCVAFETGTYGTISRIE